MSRKIKTADDILRFVLAKFLYKIYLQFSSILKFLFGKEYFQDSIKIAWDSKENRNVRIWFICQIKWIHPN